MTRFPPLTDWMLDSILLPYFIPHIIIIIIIIKNFN